MSRRTVLIVADNGAKIRTVASRAFFVVREKTVTSTYSTKTGEYERHEPRPTAWVEKRTDNLDTARTERRRHGGTIYRLVNKDSNLTVEKVTS